MGLAIQNLDLDLDRAEKVWEYPSTIGPLAERVDKALATLSGPLAVRWTPRAGMVASAG